MASLKELLAQKHALEQQILEVQGQERSDAINKIKALMADYGLTVTDLSGRASAKVASKVAPKYRNSATGETWSGRGLQPKWLKSAIASGATLADFSI